MLVIILVTLAFSHYDCQNIHSPRFPSQPVYFNVSELASVGDDVFACTASDDDTGDSAALRFSIVGGTGRATFSVNVTTCQVTLTQRLDFEAIAQYDVILQVRDLDPVSPKLATATFTIEVLKANEVFPIFTGSDSQAISMAEDVGVSTVVYQCTATDADSGLVTYTLLDGNTDRTFTLTSDLCQLSIAKPLDYESLTTYTLKIIASDNDLYRPLTSTMTLSVTVTDINEFDPVFIVVPTEGLLLPEDTATGGTVYTCSVTDGDSSLSPSGQHTVRITGGNSDQTFDLDNQTCAVTLVKDLDFETQSRHDLTLEASDLDPKSPRSTSVRVSILVTDVNERPNFKNLPDDGVLVAENSTPGTVLYTCTGRDPDNSTLPRGQLTYSIVGGNEAGLFSMDNDTCAVSVMGSLDFEGQHNYQLMVRVQDREPAAGLGVTRPLLINITDVNEHTPVFVNVPMSPIDIGELSPIGSTVFTCTARDDDSPSQPSGQLRFQIEAGNEDGKFVLADDEICRVTVAQGLDFETRFTYNLTLIVHDLDSAIICSQRETFSITVVDENDGPRLQPPTGIPTVVENSPAGTALFDCSAMDEDDPSMPKGQLAYSITSGNTNNAFSLVSPCRIETNKPLDHETQVLYHLTITVSDLDPTNPKMDTFVYTVKVTDINDNTPYFLSKPKMPIRIPEDTAVGVPLVNCTGEDDDTPLELTGKVKYRIRSGNDENFFTINPDTCDLSLQQSLDYENKTLAFNITIIIYDLDPVASRSAEQEYKICVYDVNDNRPTWVKKFPKKVQMLENPPLGTHLGNCSATDGDTLLHPSGHVRYVIKGGNNFALFYLNPYTCDLYVNGLLDYEHVSKHTLKIIAFDLDPEKPLQSTVMKMKIKILDDNDLGPTCLSTEMTTEMSEGTKRKSVVMTMNCSDVDGGRANSALRFKALSKSQVLHVEKMTGNIRLLKAQDWDDVSGSREHELMVEVRDNGAVPNIATATVRVIVTDSDDIKPVFVQTTYTGHVKEDTLRGSTVVKISATDQDEANTPASTVRYGMLSQPKPEYFLLDSYTGNLMLKRTPDAELASRHVVKVFAFSSIQTAKPVKAEVIVEIADINDNGPQFTQDVYKVSVDESKTYTAPLLTVLAKDSDLDNDGQVLYSIEDGPLDIDVTTGEIKLTRELDFEEQYFYAILVMARDKGTPSITATSTVLLSVRPLNEFSPVWTSGTEFVVSEDTSPGTVIFQLNATDKDGSWDGAVEFRSAQPLSFDLPFIVRQTGHVLLATELDYETRSSYSLHVIASDRSNHRASRRSVTMTIDVTVTDVNDLAPVCQPLPVAAVVFPWIGSTIATLDCDPDADTVNGVQLGYRIVEGDPADEFQVDNRGGLSAKVRPAHDMYDLTVEVSDGGKPAMTSRVTVMLLVEPALELTNLPGSIRVPEDVNVGTRLFSITACCSFSTFKFDLQGGNDAKLFHLHAHSGVITLLGNLDHELTSQHELRVGVKDEIGQNASATLLISILDVNDNAPVFNPLFSSQWVVEIQPVGSMLGRWTATDRDQGHNGDLTYTLLDTVNDTFSLDNSTATLYLRKPLDYETDRSYSLLLVATDHGSPARSTTATVQVVVVNADEHSPQFVTESGTTIAVPEDTALGRVLFQVQARDGDVVDVIRYSLKQEGSSSGRGLPFSVRPESGEVILRSPLDRESVQEYDLVFKAINNLGDVANMTAKVQVEDADDHDPMFSDTVYEFHVPHNTAADVTVGQVNVTDDDIGSNADFVVTIDGGNGAGYFRLDEMEVKTARPVRYDEVREFSLILTAHHTSRAFNYRYSQCVVRIYVLPEYSVPKFWVQTLVLDVAENVAVSTLICDFNATMLGATEGNSGNVRYVIQSGNKEGTFSVDADTGELRVSGSLDYETRTTYTLVVDAVSKSQPATRDSITVTVNVDNINDHAPKPAAHLFQFSVDENAAVDSSVGHVVFTDGDKDVFGTFSLTMSGCPSFDVDSSTGDLVVKKVLSYYDDVKHGCVVTATDKGQPPLSALTSVVISVNDVNNHTPQFTGAAPYVLDVYENAPVGSTLWTVVAVDLNEGKKGEVRYSLLEEKPVHGLFSINASAGHLVLTSQLRAKTVPQVVLRIQAVNGGTPAGTSETTVTFNVLDVNDNAPVMAATPSSAAVERLVPPGSQLAVVTASDDDLGDNARVTLAITAGNPEGLFFIDSTSGRLLTRGWLTKAADTYSLTVTASDHGLPALASSIPFNVFISPQNAVNTSTVTVTMEVSEDAAVGTVIGNIHPSLASRPTAYVIVGGNYDDDLELVTQADGSADVKLVKPLDREIYSTYYLYMDIENPVRPPLPALLQVNVTDVNDNAPLFSEGPSLVLTVAEHFPANHTLRVLHVHDADTDAVNGATYYRVQSTTHPDVLKVTSSGQLQLAVSPDYQIFQRMEAVITVHNSMAPRPSSSLSVTIHVIDVDERQIVHVMSPSTIYISTEIPFNAAEGQTVIQLSASDFNLTSASPSSTTTTTTTSYLSLDTSGPFSIDSVTGQVKVRAPSQLAEDSVYHYWVVCTVREKGGVERSEMAMLRIDTYDKYNNVVAVQTAMSVSDLQAHRDVLVNKLQSLFASTHRVGVYTILGQGASARRRLLATGSLALIYVVEDKTVDAVDNVQAEKIFLTWEQLLQTLQLSSDGSPVSALTGNPLPVDLVIPYQDGVSDSDPNLTQSTYFPAIIALAAIILFSIILFIILCTAYRAKKKKRAWNVHNTPSYEKGAYKNTPFNTPAPAFYIRRDTLFPDDVSSGSVSSLLDDDSGMGDSVGSRSQVRKSSTPSTISSASDTAIGGDDMTLSAKYLLNVWTGDYEGRRDSTNDVITDVKTTRQARPTRSKPKPSTEESKWHLPTTKPPLTWLPALPDESRSASRASNRSQFESPYGYPRYGRRVSSLGADGYCPSDGSSGRRVSQMWGSSDNWFTDLARRGSQDAVMTLRRSSIMPADRLSWKTPGLDSYYDSPYAIPQTGYLTSPPKGLVTNPLPEDLTTTSAKGGQEARIRTSVFGTTHGHKVDWKPKRNTVKIFHEKLQWNAVSSIPKAVPMPTRRGNQATNKHSTNEENINAKKLAPVRAKDFDPHPLSVVENDVLDIKQTSPDITLEEGKTHGGAQDDALKVLTTRRRSNYNTPSFLF